MIQTQCDERLIKFLHFFVLEGIQINRFDIHFVLKLLYHSPQITLFSFMIILGLHLIAWMAILCLRGSSIVHTSHHSSLLILESFSIESSTPADGKILNWFAGQWRESLSKLLHVFEKLRRQHQKLESVSFLGIQRIFLPFVQWNRILCNQTF